MWLWLLVILSLFWFVSLLTTKKLTSTSSERLPVRSLYVRYSSRVSDRSFVLIMIR
ncbi:hypothetical protein [Nostoc sp.]|uniref:hypothetical protein n=1 Tax=Nostoc sp. TaxID=1180 RepID=UPI002FF66188